MVFPGAGHTRMIKLFKWIGCCFLAGAISSCISGNLYRWGAESAPRSEVLGFVDRGGDGDGLLVRLHGERGETDGVYEWPMALPLEEHAGAALATPVRLEPALEKELLESLDESNQVIRLEESDAGGTSSWRRLDAFDSVNGALHRIEIADRRYYLHGKGQVEPAAVRRHFTMVEVHERRTFHGPYAQRGAAYLPAARREPGNVATAVVAAPLAIAADIVTLPLQALALLYIVGAISVNGPISFSFEP